MRKGLLLFCLSLVLYGREFVYCENQGWKDLGFDDLEVILTENDAKSISMKKVYGTDGVERDVAVPFPGRVLIYQGRKFTCDEKGRIQEIK